MREIHNLEGVLDQIALDIEVYGGGCRETRGAINLKKDRLHLVVDHKIEAEHLKAHVIVDIEGLTTHILMTQMRDPRTHSLHRHLLNLLPEQVHILATILKQLKNRRHRPFMALLSLSNVFIELKIFGIFVDAVVSQMHKHTLQILPIRHHVGFSTEAGQALFKNIDSERFYAG